MEVGAISTAFQSMVAYGTNYFYSGLAISSLLKDVEKYCEQFLEYNNAFFFLMGTPLWQCLNVLSGKSEAMDKGQVMERINAFTNVPNIMGQQALCCFGMQVAFYMGDLDKATEMADKISGTRLVAILRTCFFIRA